MIGICIVNAGGILGRRLSPPMLRFVDAEKRLRIMNFRRREDAHRTLYADLLARAVLAPRLGCSPPDLHFLTDENGKPRLAGADGPFFSLSHSGDWIMCAVGDGLIGADVEEIRPFDPATAEEFLSAGEKDDFTRLAENLRPDYYYTIWTLKECYAKAVGLGLGMPFRDLSVRLLPSGEVSFFREGRPLRDAHFQTWRPDDRHRMAVCSLGERLPEEAALLKCSELLRFYREEEQLPTEKRTIRAEGNIPTGGIERESLHG